jgi:hypothetical protein
MSKDLDFLKNVEKDTLTEFLTNRYIEEFLNGIMGDEHPISDKVNLYANLPNIGSHLKTPRIGYTHHGIYVGNYKVVHYAGLADGLNSAPVEEVSIEKFLNGKTYEVIPHPNKTYSIKEIVNRAYSRIGEDNYGVVGNNCEHFVHWCIYGVHTSQQSGAVAKTIAHTAIKSLGKNNPITNIVTATAYTGQHLVAYLNGNISKEKLFEEINHTAITTTSTVYYAGFAQAVIPIPVIGALVGATVGFYVGNLLHRSGLIALGDSNVVKIAKERRKKIEEMCKLLIPAIQKSREELEVYIDKYFADRKKIFEESFENLNLSLQNNNNELFLSSLEKINNQYGKTLGNKTFKELINSDKPPIF